MNNTYDQIIFLVQGSAKEPYQVSFIKNNHNLSANCTCPAGKNSQYCKHRINILSGRTDEIISDNKADVHLVSSWLRGSDVEIALNALITAENTYELAKCELANAKKRFGQALRD